MGVAIQKWLKPLICIGIHSYSHFIVAILWNIRDLNLFGPAVPGENLAGDVVDPNLVRTYSKVFYKWFTILQP